MQQPPGPPASWPDDSLDEPTRLNFSPFNFLIGFGFGAFAGVALALFAFTLVDEQQAAPGNAGIQPDLPVVAGTAQPAPDTRPRTRTALDVRLGPGNGFAVVGVLARGEAVEVVGKDGDSLWLAIRFPPGSVGRGWIPVTAVDSPPELSRLPVALPTPLPRTIATFPAGGFDGDAVGTGAGTVRTATPDPRATAVLRPGPTDLVVISVRLLPDRRVSVTVANRGPGDLVGFTVFVQVRDLGVRSEMLTSVSPTMRVGSTLTLESQTFTISGEETIQAIVDPFGAVPEVDRSNNQLQVVLAVPVAPTLTPTPAGEGPG